MFADFGSLELAQRSHQYQESNKLLQRIKSTAQNSDSVVGEPFAAQVSKVFLRKPVR